MAANMDSLMDFRLAYLRMIAHSWRNKCDQNFTEERLHVDFGRKFYWKDLKVTFAAATDVHGAKWDPEGTAGWFSDRNNVLTIGLPLRPEALGIPVLAQGEALAAFYSKYSTIFGEAVEYPTTHPGLIMIALSTKLGDFDSFLEFGGVVARALSVAWARPDFISLLMTDAARAMEGWLGFRPPWSLTIKVKDVSDELTYDDDTKKWDTKDESFKLNSLHYTLPNAPATQSIWPVALTSYNNTGPQYPFTCCF